MAKRNQNVSNVLPFLNRTNPLLVEEVKDFYRAPTSGRGSSALPFTGGISKQRSGSGYAWSKKELDILTKHVQNAGNNLLSDEIVDQIGLSLIHI